MTILYPTARRVNRRFAEGLTRDNTAPKPRPYTDEDYAWYLANLAGRDVVTVDDRLADELAADAEAEARVGLGVHL